VFPFDRLISATGANRVTAYAFYHKPRTMGVAQIDVNDGGGAYTITEQVWDAVAGDWADTVAPFGHVAATAYDIRLRSKGVVDDYVLYWEEVQDDGAIRLMIELAMVGDAFVVALTMDGGVAGSAVAQCTYTYEVADLAGNVLGAGVTPQVPRLVNVEYWYAGEDRGGSLGNTSTYGLAAYHGATLLLLVAYGEIAKNAICA